MGDLIVSLLPYIIGSAVVPGQILITILLLRSPQQGLFKAWAYVCGMTILRLLQGLIFGIFLTRSPAASAEVSSGKGPVVSTLLLVLGILLLIAAYKKWQKEDDPDDPPPGWLAHIDNATPLKALGIGFGLLLLGPKFWVFTLSAIATISEAKLGQLPSIVAFLLFVLLAQASVLFLLFIRIVMPRGSQTMLEKLSGWFNRYNRIITVTISLVFGLFFLYQGVSGLLR